MMMEEVIWVGPVLMAIMTMGTYLLSNQHLTVNADINDAKIVKMADYFKSKRYIYFNQKLGIGLFLIGLCVYLYANYSGICTQQEDFCRCIESIILIAVTFNFGIWMGVFTTVHYLIRQEE